MKNVAELIKIKEETLKNMKSYKYNIRVCGGTGCTSSGSMKIIDELEAQLEKAGIRDDVNIVQTGCFGLCALGPIMIVYPDGYFYSRLEPEHIEEIVKEHLVGGKPVLKYLYSETVNDGEISAYTDTVYADISQKRSSKLRRNIARKHRTVHSYGRIYGAREGA